jgi:hypothetical protein
MAGINFISTTIRNDKLNANKRNVIAAIKASAKAAALKAAALKAAANKAAALKAAANKAAAVKPVKPVAVKPVAVKPVVTERHLKNVGSRKIVYTDVHFHGDESSAIVLKKMN